MKLLTSTRTLPALLTATLLMTASISGPTLAAPGHSNATGIQSAQKLIKQKQYAAAIGKLQSLIKTDADNADAYNLLGYSNRKLKRYTAAENYYQQALTLDPKHKATMEYLGELYVETNRMSEAEAMLERLDKTCRWGCSEYRELKQFIEAAAHGKPVAQRQW